MADENPRGSDACAAQYQFSLRSRRRAGRSAGGRSAVVDAVDSEAAMNTREARLVDALLLVGGEGKGVKRVGRWGGGG
eukprot:6028916-Pleurochrysis_carterae.AAC.1